MLVILNTIDYKIIRRRENIFIKVFDWRHKIYYVFNSQRRLMTCSMIDSLIPQIYRY